MSINLTVNGTTFSYPEQGDTNWGADATDWAAAVTAGMLQKAGGTFQLLSEVDFGTGFGLKSLYYKSRTANVADAGQIRLARADVISFRNQANDGNLDLSVDASNNLLFNGVSLAGVATVSDTESIDLTLTGVDLTADLNLSAEPATGTNLKVLASMEADGLQLQLLKADGSTDGYLDSADWTTFNSKQAAGNYITALTGDVVAAGPGSVAATIQNDVITNAMINSAAAIAYSKLDLSNSIVNADVNAAAAIEYAKLDLTGGIISTDVAAGAAIEYTKLEVLTAQRALVSSGAGYVSASAVTATELGYLAGVTSLVQTQLDAKVAKSTLTTKGDIFIATAASTITRLQAGSNGQVLIADSTTTEGARWGAAASGGINYITNTNFAADTAGWATYADAAGTQPVNGTGGAANITFTRDTNSLVIGTTSGLITKDAANRQGEGVSYDFSIDTALKNCPVKISNYLAASANFVFGSIDAVTPSDITVWIYDVTNSVLITPFPNTLTSNTGQFTAAFQATSSTSYRLIYHIGTTNAAAWTLALGNVEVGPQDTNFIPADSDWVGYTPTFTGLGTPTSVSFRYRKQGPNLEVEGRYISGSPTTATEMRISLPTGLTSASDYTTLQNVGLTWTSTSAGTGHVNNAMVLIEPSVSYFTFAAPTTTTLSKANANAIVGSTQTIVMSAKVRIQGWTSGFTTADTVLQNVPAVLVAYKNGGALSANTTIASWTSAVKDSVGMMNLTSGVITIKTPGDYYIDFNVTFTASGGNPKARLKLNSTVILIANEGDLSDSMSGLSTILPNLKVGDTIEVDVDTARTAVSTDTGTRLSIHKIETPAASMNIRKIATLKDEKAANTAGGTATSGSYATRTLQTEVDPFGIVSLSANQFTLQPGTYKVSASAPGFYVNSFKIKLRNITAGSDTIIGNTGYAGDTDGNNSNTFSSLTGVFSISVATVFEIQQRVATTRATNGLGNLANFGDVEVYTQVEIEKLL